MRLLWVILVLAGLWIYHDDIFAAKELPVPQELMQQIYTPPVQKTVSKPAAVFLDGKLNFLASYDITARVMARSNYRLGTGAKVAPIDFALGWGPMSIPGMDKKLSVGQGYRTYHYSWSDVPPLPPENILLNSANVHLIPANDDVKDQLNDVRKGQLINLKGYLVRYREEKPRGGWWEWNSSMTRSDTGDGACELLYVESVRIY